MKLREMVASVQEKEDLVRFIRALAEDRHTRSQEWENPSLEQYLDALASWLEDSDGYYRNHGLDIPVTPTWKTFAEMLIAAKIYE
jgi:hypothetical protein